MALRKAVRPHTRAIREMLLEGPATCDEVTDRVWMMYPAGPCIRKYRVSVDRRRAARGIPKTAEYPASIDEQHRYGARMMITFTLIGLVRHGHAVKEGDRYRLL